MSRTTLALSLVAIAAAFAPARAAEPPAGTLTLAPYTLRTYDGQAHDAELGKLTVRENRSGPSTRVIELAFVRLKSTAAKPAAPIVWLAGGPGTPGIVMARIPVYYSLFEKLRDVADVILLDQRGSGMSVPSLVCAAVPVPRDVFESADKWLRAYSGMSAACARKWRAEGVELAAYSNDANADDLEDLRVAIGADKLSLLGHSYGTVLAQAAIRRHGDRLERVVMAAVEGPDNLLALPSVWDAFIAKLSQLAAEDPAAGKNQPTLEATYRRVLTKLERKPVTLTIADAQTKLPIEIRVGKIGVQWLVRLNMNDARTYATLPALFRSIDEGDYAMLARQLEPLYQNFKGRSPMANAIDCSAGWSAERFAQSRREAAHALFSNVNLQWTPEVCRAVGVTKIPAPPARVTTAVPTLFVSGTLDTNTPPFEAEEVRWGFTNSTHLVVENSGHEMLPSAEVQSVIVDFFRGEDVGGRRVAFPRPRFVYETPEK